MDGDLEDVGLELHEHIVGAGPAVHFQAGQGDAGVGPHGLQHVADLVGDGLQGGPDDVVLVHATGQAHDGPPGVLVPVGGPQAGEGGDHVAPGGVGHLPGVVLAVGGGVDEPHLVPQPLDGGPRHEDGALQGVADPAAQAPGHGGHQTAAGEDGLVSSVHQQEAAGAIGVLGLAGGKAGLTEESGLLVPGGPGNGNGTAEEPRVGLPIDLAAGNGGGEHGPGNIHEVQQLLIPVQGVDVEEHGPGGVGVVGDVDPASGEQPDQPGLHCAEEELPRLRPPPGAGDVVQYPADLGAREVGVHHQPRLPADCLRVASCFQLVAVGAGAAALPDDGVVHRFPGGPVPDHGGLPLVGDADGGDVRGCGSDLSHGLHRHAQLGGPDLPCVMLHPAGLWEDLRKFLLGGGPDAALLVEEDAAVAGGAGVKGHDVLRHGEVLLLWTGRRSGGWLDGNTLPRIGGKGKKNFRQVPGVPWRGRIGTVPGDIG